MSKTRFALTVGLVATTLAAQALAASSATADSRGTEEDCPKAGWTCDWSSFDYTPTYPWDDGGTGATVTIGIRDSYGEGQGSYQAKFHAYDETLDLSDHWADGARIHGYARYTIDGESTIERFSVGGGVDTFEIGPGNNLPEGQYVAIGFYVPGNDQMPNAPSAEATA